MLGLHLELCKKLMNHIHAIFCALLNTMLWRFFLTFPWLKLKLIHIKDFSEYFLSTVRLPIDPSMPTYLNTVISSFFLGNEHSGNIFSVTWLLSGPLFSFSCFHLCVLYLTYVSTHIYLNKKYVFHISQTHLHFFYT